MILFKQLIILQNNKITKQELKSSMETVKDVLLSSLIKILMSNSPAYGNSIPFVKQDSLADAISKVQVGDVILTKTHHSIYQVARKFVNSEYDHVSIVINEKEVIHISPPIISKLEIESIMRKSREPLVYRYPIENKEILLSVLNNFLGQRYNQQAIPDILKRQVKARFEISEHYNFSIASIKYSRICSDAILYALCRSNEKLNNSIAAFALEKTKYSTLGYFLVSQIGEFLQQNGAEIVIKSPENTDKTLYDRTLGFQEYLQKVRIQIGPYFNILKLIPQKKGIMKQLIHSKFLKFLLVGTSPQFRAITIAYLLYDLLAKKNQKTQLGKKMLESFIYWLMVSKMLPNNEILLPKL